MAERTIASVLKTDEPRGSGGSNPSPSAQPSDHEYYVYVLRNAEGRFYVGSSASPDERFKSHNAGRVRSTKAFRPWQRVLLESYPDRFPAEKRERYLKSGWGRKELRKLLGDASGLAT